MAVSVVQGASRGLGLQFCKHVLAWKPNAVVYATCRNPQEATNLMQLRQEYGEDRLKLATLDATKEEDISRVAKEIASQHKGVDLLVNCSAMLHPSGRGETSLKAVDPQALGDTLMLNSIGPLVMAKHFAPLLQKGTGRFGSPDNKQVSGVIVNISAKVGSITDNGLGGWYSYRMSKAALNMATKNLSVELSRGKSKVICVSLHPGTVDTDLSRPYHKGVPKDKLFTSEYSVNCLMKIIDNLTLDQNGKFFSWDRSELAF